VISTFLLKNYAVGYRKDQMDEFLEKISEKKKQLDELRPLSVDLEKKLYERSKILLTYNSNALEGNTLSLAETAQLIKMLDTMGYEKLVEHLQAAHSAKAVDSE
jgi:Fic family protein